MTSSGLKQNVGSVSGNYMFAPNTIKAVGFKLQFRSQQTSASAQVQETNASSQLVLMEVVA